MIEDNQDDDLIGFIYLLKSLSQPNKAKSEPVSTHTYLTTMVLSSKIQALNYGAPLG